MAFDILATNETKLDNYGANSQISLPGHTGVRKDRNKYWGGVRIYKGNSINFTRKLNFEDSDLEMMSIEILTQFQPIFINPPRTDLLNHHSNYFSTSETFLISFTKIISLVI